MGRRQSLFLRSSMALVMTLTVPVAALVGLGGYLTQVIQSDVDQKVEATLDLAIQMEESLLAEGAGAMQQAAAAVAADRGVVALLAGEPAAEPLELDRLAGVFHRADVLLVVDRQARVVARAGSVATGDQVSLDGLVPSVIAEGEARAHPALLPGQELQGERPALLAQIDMPIMKTGGSADPRVGGRVDTALALTGVVPVRAGDGRVLGAVVAADVLNRDFRIVDEVAGRAPEAMDLHATIAMDGIRVTTTVPAVDPSGNKLEYRALGTLYSDRVMDALREQHVYRGRAEVVGRFQRTIYKAMLDYRGQMIAASYVGVPETYFTTVGSRLSGPVRFALGAGGGALLLVLAAGLWWLYRGVVRPVRGLVQAVAAGDMTALEYPVNDELGDLAAALRRQVADTRDAMRRMESLAERMAQVTGVMDGATAEAHNEAERALAAAASGSQAVARVHTGAAPTMEYLSRLHAALQAVGDGVRREERSVMYVGRVVEEIGAALQAARQEAEAAVVEVGRLAAETRTSLKQAGELAAGLALLRQGATDQRALDLLRDPSDVLTAMATLADRAVTQVRSAALQVQESQARLTFIQEEMHRVEAVVRETAGQAKQAGETAQSVTDWMEQLAGQATSMTAEVQEAQVYLGSVAAANRQLRETCRTLKDEVEAFKSSL